jgi:DNA-binding LacI/PurR family transcriptional regulator
MYRLAEYLILLGHNRRVAWVGHHRDYPPLKERRDALLEAYSKLAAGAEVRTFAGKDNLEGGWQVTREMLDSGFKPTAVVCANDFMAVGVLRALREHGIAVPEQVSVTGLDNIKLAEFCYPTLTTIHIPRDRVGRLMFEKLMGGVETPGFGTELVIDPDLVIRDSTGPAPQ